MDDDQPRKLIEVALPLLEISKASVADKNRKVGTIKNLHKWFAPMPTPALRALIFASLVNDPGTDAEREVLMDFIKQLVPENGTAPAQEVLEQAKKYIARDNPALPTVLEPFCGGGSTVVEAQRLGLPVVASDLNPVAVLITRVLGEMLPPMAHAPSLSVPEGQLVLGEEKAPFEGFAADLRYYGDLVQRAVHDKLGDLYPTIPQGEPVAWLWSRTIPCPNPMCRTTVPLFSSPILSKQSGREASLEPVVEGKDIRFVVHTGKGALDRGRSVKIKGARARFECIACSQAVGEKELRAAGSDHTMGLQLMAVCIDEPRGGGGRTFLAPDAVADPVTEPTIPDDLSELKIGDNRKNFSTPLYGLPRQIDLYTPRQLAVLAAFADEVAGIADRVLEDGGDERRAKAIASVLSLCIGKLAQSNSTLVRFATRKGPSRLMAAFGMQAMPMLWDFAEAFPFGRSIGSWDTQIAAVSAALPAIPTPAPEAHVVQMDARVSGQLVRRASTLLVTDPPYYAQINYADLSDYFYLWIRRAMRGIQPDLFATMATPKDGELVANPARYDGSPAKARSAFIKGFTEVFASLKEAVRPDLPMVVAYAHKQDEEMVDGVTSTGWESLLEAILAAGLGVVRTWPIEAATTAKQVSQGANALATYVILICKPRPQDLPVTDRQGFLDALGERLPDAIMELGNVDMVDLAQAAIGPGMEVFCRFSQVLERDGKRMPVRTALALINDKLQSIIWDTESEFDRETRAAVAWYDEHGWDTADEDEAGQIAWGKNTTVPRLVQADIMWAKAGDARLLTAADITIDGYDPHRDLHPTAWATRLRLSELLETKGLETAARMLSGVMNAVPLDQVAGLTRLLYKIGESHKRSDDQQRFNRLVTEWPELVKRAREIAAETQVQPTLDDLTL
jgi:putative DNA methylase